MTEDSLESLTTVKGDRILWSNKTGTEYRKSFFAKASPKYQYTGRIRQWIKELPDFSMAVHSSKKKKK